MKRIIFFIAFMLTGVMLFGQASPVADFRISNATTAFGQNLPTGTKVYNVGTGEYWVANTGVVGTATLTTGAASFDLIATGGGVLDLSYDAGNHRVDITGGGTSAVIPLAVDDGATEGLASFTAADFTVTAGNVVIDYANGQEATVAQDGFLSSTDWTTFNNKVSNVTTNLSEGTVTNDQVDVNSSDGTNATLLAASTSRAGVMTKAKFDEVVANTSAISAAYLNTATDKFEGSGAHTLSNSGASTSGAIVSLNGSVLDPGDYTLTSTTITVDGVGTLDTYDQVVITYKY